MRGMMSQCLPASPSEGQSGCCSGSDLTPAPSPRPASPLPSPLSGPRGQKSVLCSSFAVVASVVVLPGRTSAHVPKGPTTTKMYLVFQTVTGLAKSFCSCAQGPSLHWSWAGAFTSAEPVLVVAQARRLLQLRSASSFMGGHHSVSFTVLAVFVLAHG